MKKSNTPFICFFLIFVLFIFFVWVLIYNNKEKIKNSYIVIIIQVMIIKKRSGGKDAMLLGDFALEPSENFKAKCIYFADSIDFKQV